MLSIMEYTTRTVCDANILASTVLLARSALSVLLLTSWPTISAISVLQSALSVPHPLDAYPVQTNYLLSRGAVLLTENPK